MNHCSDSRESAVCAIPDFLVDPLLGTTPYFSQVSRNASSNPLVRRSALPMLDLLRLPFCLGSKLADNLAAVSKQNGFDLVIAECFDDARRN
jgi:hypothetical protein